MSSQGTIGRSDKGGGGGGGGGRGEGGSPFNINCNAPSVYLEWLWYRNGLMLSPSTSTLVVPSPTLAGTAIYMYQCFAYGPVANVSAAGNITILSESGPFIILFLY